MSNEPLVSIIIIFLNAEKFIEEAIESAFAQTYNNWELLLVDDGSTDSSTRIALHYAEHYPEKVRYFEHPGHQNRGMSAARNLGLSHAKGAYIGFLDADDVWLPYKLEQQVAILNSYPEAGVVYGSTQYWCGWTGRPEDVRGDSVPELGVHTDALFKPPTLLTLLYPLGSATAPSMSNLLFRRRVVESTGGPEDSFKDIYEDRAFMSKVCLKESVFVASQCWDRYRQHPNSSLNVARGTSQHHDARLFFLNWLEKYLFEQGVEDAKVWKRLREEQLIAQVRARAHKRQWKEATQDLFMLLRHHPQAFIHVYQRLRAHMRMWGSASIIKTLARGWYNRRPTFEQR